MGKLHKYRGKITDCGYNLSIDWGKPVKACETLVPSQHSPVGEMFTDMLICWSAHTWRCWPSNKKGYLRRMDDESQTMITIYYYVSRFFLACQSNWESDSWPNLQNWNVLFLRNTHQFTKTCMSQDLKVTVTENLGPDILQVGWITWPKNRQDESHETCYHTCNGDHLQFVHDQNQISNLQLWSKWASGYNTCTS